MPSSVARRASRPPVPGTRGAVQKKRKGKKKKQNRNNKKMIQTRLQVRLQVQAKKRKLLDWFKQGGRDIDTTSSSTSKKRSRMALIRCQYCSEPMRWDKYHQEEQSYWNGECNYVYWVPNHHTTISGEWLLKHFKCGECGKLDELDDFMSD